MTSSNERFKKDTAELHPSKCPECNNVDNLTAAETKMAVHCQRCYRLYKYQGGR